ncbi:MAG TPA: DNA alkylation repair protein [Planctomycetaceae bacterium]|nr:DNA alkylation repair protein [Planctomycetaceae bacterium]
MTGSRSQDVKHILKKLESLGSEQTVKIFRKHGADGEMFGVKVADLKKVLREIRGDQELAIALWDTGNSDAMYLASLVADGAQMTQKQLDHWAKTAWWYMLSEYAVPFVAAENPACFQLSTKWMRSRKESIASSGWASYANGIGVWNDEDLDKDEIATLLADIPGKIDKATGRVRYCMNGFVICVGTYIPSLTKAAKATAKSIGKVDVDMGETSCKVPLASAAIEKVESMGRIGKKRKNAKC